MTREWGCPECKSTKQEVIDVARDEDGYPVRLRRCLNCGVTWGTEETPLAPGSYWGRAYSRNRRRVELSHQRSRPCRWCGVRYRVGSFTRHVAQSEVHEAALTPRGRNLKHARRYGRAWARRKAAS